MSVRARHVAFRLLKVRLRFFLLPDDSGQIGFGPDEAGCLFGFQLLQLVFRLVQRQPVLFILDRGDHVPRARIQARALERELGAHCFGEELFVRKKLLGLCPRNLRFDLLQSGTGLIRAALQCARIKLNDHIPFFNLGAVRDEL